MFECKTTVDSVSSAFYKTQ